MTAASQVYVLEKSSLLFPVPVICISIGQGFIMLAKEHIFTRLILAGISHASPRHMVLWSQLYKSSKLSMLMGKGPSLALTLLMSTQAMPLLMTSKPNLTSTIHWLGEVMLFK